MKSKLELLRDRMREPEDVTPEVKPVTVARELLLARLKANAPLEVPEVKIQEQVVTTNVVTMTTLEKLKARQLAAKVAKEAEALSNATYIKPTITLTPAPIIADELKTIANIEQENNIVIENLAVEGEYIPAGTPISYDKLDIEQQEAVDLAAQGISFCLTGPAGSGKTTAQTALLSNLLMSGQVRRLRMPTKFLREGSPSVAIVAFTNKAVAVIRKYAPAEFKNNCLTIHKLTEFEPELELREIMDEESGELKQVEIRVFKPQRTSANPIQGLTHIVIEESSQVGRNLETILFDALPPDIVVIRLGDINQIQPVMDEGTFLYYLSVMRVVELTKIHRTAEDSPILGFAHSILRGERFSTEQLTDMSITNVLEFHGLSPMGNMQRAKPELVAPALGKKFAEQLTTGEFIAGTDVILCPFNTGGSQGDGVNCKNINLFMAQAQGELNDAVVYHIIAGYRNQYFAEGDIILFKKVQWRILNIEPNSGYIGKAYQEPSVDLNRWGKMKNNQKNLIQVDSEELLSNVKMYAMDEEDDKVNKASHSVTIQSLDDESVIETVDTASDLQPTNFTHGYAMTVHKAQGSEFRKVWFVLHYSHARMLSRELIYTGSTRAIKTLHIYFDVDLGTKPNTVAKAIARQEIVGDTVAEKIAYLKEQKAIEEAAEATAAMLAARLVDKARGV